MKGVLDALLIHEANKLINATQRNALIKKYNLESYDKNLEKDTDRIEAVKLVHGIK